MVVGEEQARQGERIVDICVLLSFLVLLPARVMLVTISISHWALISSF